MVLVVVLVCANYSEIRNPAIAKHCVVVRAGSGRLSGHDHSLGRYSVVVLGVITALGGFQKSGGTVCG